MTLLSDIITRAYRESNLIPLVSAAPTAAQTAEGLYLLNELITSTVGNEAGDGLEELNINDSDGTYNEETLLNPYIPDNLRLMFNNTAAKEYNLDPYPKEGQRFAVVDVLGNFATYNVVLNGNGRRIEDASSLTLNTDDLVRQWMYRSDLGNWVRISELVAADTLPFPLEFDAYFRTMLATALNPRYGQSLSPETQQILARSRGQLRDRYSRPTEILPDIDTRGYSSDYGYSSYSNDQEFNTGRLQRWR